MTTMLEDCDGTLGLGDAWSGVLAATIDLAPLWSARAARTEELQALPKETVEELFDAGLMQMLAPRRYGGLELEWPAIVEASRVAARVCASTAWTIALVGGHAAIAGRLSQPMQERIFATGPRQFISTATPATGSLAPHNDGFRVSGLWRFSSGIDHATWILTRCFHSQAPQRERSPMYLALIEPEQLTVMQAGGTLMGMRGTGSKDFSVTDAFLSVDMGVTLAEVLDAGPPGAAINPDRYVYDVPFRPYFYSALIGAILGCAEGAYDIYLERTRASSGSTPGNALAGNPCIHERVAESSAKLACAAHVYRGIVDKLHAAGLARRSLTPHEDVQVARDRAYLANLCVDAVHGLVRRVGTRAMLEADPLCRHWRDLQVMASHLDVNWDSGMLAFGKHVLQGPIRRH